MGDHIVTHTHVLEDGTVLEHTHVEEHRHAGEKNHGHVHPEQYAHGEHEHSHGHTHQNTKAVLNRLSRAIGHLESIRRMVEDGRDCTEVLIQLSAVKAAINNTGKVILRGRGERRRHQGAGGTEQSHRPVYEVNANGGKKKWQKNVAIHPAARRAVRDVPAGSPRASRRK